MIRAVAHSVFIALSLATTVVPACAQPVEAQGQSYINPFPEGEIYRVHVIGDWQAESLLPSLSAALQSEGRGQLQLPRKAHLLTGLARSESEEQIAETEEYINRETIHVAIVFVGGADRTHFRTEDGKRIRLGTEEWRAEYGKRADRLMRALKRRNAAVYWVGQPILRRAESNDDVQALNDVLRERAVLNGQRFIDVYQGFADEDGNYNAHGPDVSGKIRQLRASDGYGFTPDGYRKLAHFIERDIKRDLTQALAERNIPLAGAEAEQAKINPGRAIAAQAAQRAAQATAAGGATLPKGIRDLRAWTTTVQTPPSASVPGAEQRADNSRITLKVAAAGGRDETVQIDIVRPAIPASALALVSRRAATERVAQFGDFVRESAPGGALLLSSVTATGEGGQRRIRSDAVTQSAYYRVMVRGDRIPAKPGRADDLSWPRSDSMADVPPPAVAQPVAAQPGQRPTPTTRPKRSTQ
jgi:hypothetical protein